MPRKSSPTRRADILLAARDAFNAGGFAGTRMEDIAGRVGISKAALYLQFESKQVLFKSLVQETIAAMLPQAAPEHFGDMPAETVLRRFIAFMAERIASPEMAFVPRVIIGEGTNFPELARFYHDTVIARGLGVLDRIIAHGVARGEFACADPHQACRSIVGGVLFGALWKIVFEPVGAEPLDASAMARTHADTVLSGLLVRKEAA
jgi:AcrR family transcriptional regulator